MRSSLRASLAMVALSCVASTTLAQAAADRITYWTSGTLTSGDPALVWKSTPNHLGINTNTTPPADPVAVLQVMWDANSKLFTVGGQGHGTDPRVFAVGDGNLGAPINSESPTAVFIRSDATNFPFDPEDPDDYNKKAYIAYQFGVEKSAGNGSLLALHGYARVTSPQAYMTIANTGSIVMEPTPGIQPVEGQTGFGMWARAERLSPDTRIASAEFDVFNNVLPTPRDAPPPFHIDTQNYTLGLQIAGEGTAKNTMAIEITKGAASAGQFWSGIVFTNESVSGYGIDMRDLGPSVVPILLPNNTFMKARNAANTADVRLLGIAGDDTLRLGTDDMLIIPNEVLLSPGGGFGTKRVGIGTTLTAPDAALEVNGGDTKGLRIRPRTISGTPNFTGSTGTLVVDPTGTLWIKTSTGWKKVGLQT